jgi:hypothetical protein
MYFDASRNAYIDRDTGEVVYQEAEHVDNVDVHPSDIALYDIERPATAPSTISPRNSARLSTPPKSAFQNIMASLSGSRDSHRLSGSRRPGSTPRSHSNSHQLIRYVSGSGIELGATGASGAGAEDQKTALEDELYNIHETNNYDAVAPSSQERSENPSSWEDWSLARAVQALEFEIPQETDPYEDFNNKEYSASRSCFRQLMTLSTFICVVQIALLIAMIEYDGIVSETNFIFFILSF